MISAVVQAQPNAPAMASIQIPANDYALDLKPRTLVHLFFYDIYNGAPPPERVAVGGPGVRIQSRSEPDPELAGLFPPERFEATEEHVEEDLENENYKLLFGGEVVGFSYTKTSTSRGVVLQCMDWSSYWDIAFQYQVSGMSLGGGGIRAAFTGASTNLFNSFLDGSGDIVAKLMARPPRSYPKLRGTLLGAVVHIIEAIGGVYFGENAIRGVNDFFSLAEMRLHLTQMVGANPFDQNDERRLLRARGFGSLFRRALSGLGKTVSIRQVLLALQKYIFHEIIPITSPRYIPPLVDPNLPQYETAGLIDNAATRPLATAAQEIKTRAEELAQRQGASVDVPAAEEQSNQRGGLIQELTRLARSCEQASRQARRLRYTTIGDAQNVQYDTNVSTMHAAFSVAGSFFNDVLTYLRRSGGRGFFNTVDNPLAQRAQNELGQISSMMQRVLETRFRRRVPRTLRQPDPPPRLITQIYRPDVWMVAPPRCNVLFPELYSQFQYQRSFNAEISRVLLRTHSAFFGSDILFDGFFVAPSRLLGQRTSRRLGRGRIGQSPEGSDAPAHWVRDLMEHELFTGIIPSFERMSDLNLHVLRGGGIVVDDERMRYAQLAVNHIFFQYRFKSRQLQLSGKFNPYLVLGFPALVVDSYLPMDELRNGSYDPAVARRLAEAVREGEGEIGAPSAERRRIAEANTERVNDAFNGLIEARPKTQYIGMPMSIVHSASAESSGTAGSTAVQMTYARTTNERTEFLGDNIAYTSTARRTRNQRISTKVAALEAPPVGSRGPRGGEIVEVVDVTDAYARRQRGLRSTNRTATGQERYRGGTRLPLFIADRSFSGRRRRGTAVLVGIEQPAASYGPEVVGLVGSAGTYQSSIADANEILVTFRAFKVTEQLGVYVRESVDLAPEELTFPPWFGEHYRTRNIGGIYGYLFGTGALTDPVSVLERFVSGSVDGGTITGIAPAAERDPSTRLEEEASRRVEGVAAFEDQPGAPPVSGGLPGPPGEPVPDDIAPALGAVRARGHVSEAVDEIVRVYSLVRHRGFDVNEFIKAYTWRPIASMVDLFGTSSLEIDDRGAVVRGVEGFHSRAFGDYDDLRLLVGPSEGDRPPTILGLQVSDPDETGDGNTPSRQDQIAARLDTRKEKRIGVLRYVYSLMTQRGILG